MFGCGTTPIFADRLTDSLKRAVLNSDLAAVRKAIAAGANPKNIPSILAYACDDTKADYPVCDVQIALLLISHGADVNARDRDGTTPLIDLAFVNDPSTVPVAKALLAHGAKLGLRDSDGRTALEEAVVNNATELFEFLTHYPFDVNDRDKSDKSMLMWACWQGPADESKGNPNVDLARFLVRDGADVNAHTKDGRTPLMWLARVDPEFESEAIVVAKDLVKHGARVDMRNSHGKTAFQVAYANGLRKLARSLRSVENGKKLFGIDSAASLKLR